MEMPTNMAKAFKKAFDEARKREMEKNIRAKRVFRSGDTMIVLWSDNTRTKASCGTGDHFDPLVGFSICLRKKLFNKEKIDRIYEKHLKGLEQPCLSQSSQT